MARVLGAFDSTLPSSLYLFGNSFTRFVLEPRAREL